MAPPLTRNKAAPLSSRARCSASETTISVMLDYRGRPWAQIPLEVAPAEASDVLTVERADPLRISQFGLTEPESIPIVNTDDWLHWT